MRKILLMLATGFGAGYIPKTAGTAGTLVAIPLYWSLKDLPWPSYGLTLVGLFFFSSWVATQAGNYLGGKDNQFIVIDEILGLLVTYFLIPFSWPLFISGFLLFRLFDIWKPMPIPWIEKKIPAGWGVVADDLMAGVYANVCLQLVILF